MDLKGIYLIFHSSTPQYTLFSANYETFSKIDNILGHKLRFIKYKKLEITSCKLSDFNRIKLELNNERNSRKYSNIWRLNNMLFHDKWVIKEIREEI
jgi:hypothetical protein